MGMLFALFCALALGTVIAYPLGLGRLGRPWHFGIGLAGLAVSWVFMAYLPLPGVMRVAVNGVSVYPFWAALFAFTVGLVVVILQAPRRE